MENRHKLNNNLLHNGNARDSAKALVLNRILSFHVIFFNPEMEVTRHYLSLLFNDIYNSIIVFCKNYCSGLTLLIME